MKVKQQVILFGATGNMGMQSLKMLALSSKHELVAVSGYENTKAMQDIILNNSSVEQVLIFDKQWIKDNRHKYLHIEFHQSTMGYENIIKAYPQATIINCISGFAGLKVSFLAMQYKHNLLLANKESLVLAGDILTKQAKLYDLQIIPLDSEHSAILQCIENNNPIKKLLLTASGGAFFQKSLEELKTVGYSEVLKHPNWNMGEKITIDSGTMMNKAYEMLECYHLFATKNIEVLIHPQSIIHSGVEFFDRQVKVQMSVPNMEQVIAYGLNYPKRPEIDFTELDFSQMLHLSLIKIDETRFAPIKLARICIDDIRNNSLTVGLNAINETLRWLFINKKISFYELNTLIPQYFALLEREKLENYQDIKIYNDKIKQMILLDLEKRGSK